MTVGLQTFVHYSLSDGKLLGICLPVRHCDKEAFFVGPFEWSPSCKACQLFLGKILRKFPSHMRHVTSRPYAVATPRHRQLWEKNSTNCCCPQTESTFMPCHNTILNGACTFILLNCYLNHWRYMTLPSDCACSRFLLPNAHSMQCVGHCH